MNDERFLDLKVSFAVHARKFKGECKLCGSTYGSDPDAPRYSELDLMSWVFGYCSNRCRLAAGFHPTKADIDEAVARAFSDAS